MVAVAFFGGARGDPSWMGRSLRSHWLETLLSFRSHRVPQVNDYDATQLFLYLANQEPKVVCKLIQVTLEEAESGALFKVFTPSSWDAMHQIAPAYKTGLWLKFAERPAVQWFLFEHLLGPRTDWLQSLLDQGLITPKEALESRDGIGAEPSIEDLARLLIRRGISPEDIAIRAAHGGWVGERSNQFAALVTQFEAMRTSSEDPLRRVGEAGVRIFTEARAAALAEERKRRVQGRY